MPNAPPEAECVRAAEVIGALSLATDLGMGLPFEHGLQSTLFAARLSRRLGVDEETSRQAYYACLLFHSGCTTDAELGAEIFGGSMTRHHLPVMFGSQTASLLGVLLAAAGIERVPRVAGVRDGLPLLEDGRVLDVTNVIWCTGFAPALDWIDLPGVAHDDPVTDRGIVADHPGLYFVGLLFLYAVSSAMVHGLARDAAHVADHIATRRPRSTPARLPAGRSRGPAASAPGGP